MSSRRRTSSFSDGALASLLERIYARYNRRVYVNPDPLVFLYGYEDVRDREIVALVASCLAYGRVAQILKSVSAVLERMGKSPRRFMDESTEGGLARFLPASFRHRFNTGAEIGLLMVGVKRALEESGSLEACFLEGLGDGGMEDALDRFSWRLNACLPKRESFLLPSPRKGSACKRLNLMLRWLARDDEVDPGGWSSVPASKLLVPLDTHMFRIAGELGLCERKSADFKSVIEITSGFAGICPGDPVRYDFALTRFGIHPEISRMSLEEGMR